MYLQLMTRSLSLLTHDFSCEVMYLIDENTKRIKHKTQMFPWPLREAICECLPDKEHSKSRCKWRDPPSTGIQCVANPLDPGNRTGVLCGGAKEHCPEKPVDFRQQCSTIAFATTFDITDPFLRFDSGSLTVENHWNNHWNTSWQ